MNLDIFNLMSINPDLYYAVELPLIIILSRIIDVTLGTFRIILVIQGRKALATIFGFFEVLIWVIIAGQVMSKLNNPLYYVAWAGGFAIGIYLGMMIEEKVSLGMSILRIIVKNSSDKLIHVFMEHNINTTIVDARSKHSEVKIIFSVIPRKRVKEAEALIQAVCGKDTLYTVENVRTVRNSLPLL